MKKKIYRRKASKSREDKIVSQNKESKDELLSMEEGIALLKTSRATFARWLKAGQIKGVKLGRKWRFEKKEIERILKGEEQVIEGFPDINPLADVLKKMLSKIGIREVPGEHESKEIAYIVRLIIYLAYKMNASDIHITPHIKENSRDKIGLIRYRVDGVMHSIAEFDIKLLQLVVDEWKRISSCNVLEKTKPQSGRMGFLFQDKKIDVRISTLPTVLGEAVNGRILGGDMRIDFSIDGIGFGPEEKNKLLYYLNRNSGAIVVTGPTASGKTSTLYSFLSHLSRPERRIITVEDPVEYLFPLMTQLAVNSAIGNTFPVLLRSSLRSDPDVIMIGEIRDAETLSLSQMAARVGHLVFTAMHQEKAVGALKQMADMGNTPLVMSNTTKLIIAQKLIRKLCPDCAKSQVPRDLLIEQAKKIAENGGLNWETLKKDFKSPVGCKKCFQTGYKGRIMTAELLEITHEIESAVIKGASVGELQEIAVKQGMVTIAADALRKASEGLTSIEEIVQVFPVK